MIYMTIRQQKLDEFKVIISTDVSLIAETKLKGLYHPDGNTTKGMKKHEIFSTYFELRGDPMTLKRFRSVGTRLRS